MMIHHVVHESFKNNISNNSRNIDQGGHPAFRGANSPSRPLLNATLDTNLMDVLQLLLRP